MGPDGTKSEVLADGHLPKCEIRKLKCLVGNLAWTLNLELGTLNTGKGRGIMIASKIKRRVGIRLRWERLCENYE